MSKATAFTFCAISGVVTLLAIPVGQWAQVPFCGCFGPLFLILTLTFGFIGYSKVSRDQRSAEQQIAQRYVEPLEPGYGERAQPTTPGSSMISLDFTKAPPPESV